MKIYTKTGDTGKTSLIGGTRVAKSHERLEAYGTLDELISWTGLLRDHDIDTQLKEALLEVQDRLMTASSLLATDSPNSYEGLPKLIVTDIEFLEREIDRMETGLPPLRSFILPGGNMAVSHCHIARTICRRAERIVIKLSEDFDVDTLIIRYINRLSDYFFMLSRRLSFDLQADEVSWKPRL
ncbi:MAG: cob(I)yrinic acid a,c-diamide adenosyltransferase [Bacteroidales bacterium]|nr:cob(I)yrinic acid a,c-diamide adenosyltransferase [Bacteroidales bacterium]MCF8456290.1 cob(I)yrinic acid a,c-diamide adenosyltransferase [Bacteroidales bacterium]